MNANAQDFNPNGYQPPQQQQDVSQEDPGYMGAPQHASMPYYDPLTGYQEYAPMADPAADPSYYPTSSYTDPSYAEWNEVPQPEATLPGYYSPLPNLITPQLYGAPISALAYNDEYKALHVASHTQPIRGRGHRASMMVTHSTLDGMLYSSCAAHPELAPHSLQTVYDCLYGGGTVSRQRSLHPPAHAYQPSYGENAGTFSSQLGITTLLPIQGYVTSVSPSAVRVHTVGGLCVSDQELEGMVAGTPHPGFMHLSVGGVAMGNWKSHVHNLDVYQGLRIVSSQTLRSESSVVPFGVMCMATNHDKQTIVAGCSDGTLRLLDGSWRKRGGTELARIKSHAAGVTDVAVSADGNLVCTTGFASRPASGQYAFPDQHVYIYDVRYLGRGGVSHPFNVVQGGPRLVSFIPDVADQPRNRVLMASGQAGGGMQIMVPFENTGYDPASFILPQLDRRETITAMTVSDEYLAIGTSESNVFQYEMAGAESTLSYRPGQEFVPSGPGVSTGMSSGLRGEASKEKKPLELPTFVPPLPAISIDPTVLQQSDRGRAGMVHNSIFNSYLMCADPTVSTMEGSLSGFAKLANEILLMKSKRNLSEKLLQVATKEEGDIMATIPTSQLDLDLVKVNEDDKRRDGKKQGSPNPNRLLNTKKLAAICFEKSVTRDTGKARDRRADANQRNRKDKLKQDDEDSVPSRYRIMLASHAGAGFNSAQYNDTGLWPGWDYAPSMPNSYAPPVLLSLFFIPEIRSSMLARQFDNRIFSSNLGKAPLLSTELGFLFHQIDCLCRYARLYPGEQSAKVGAFVPANFLTTFAMMPEAEALALLDGAPAAVEKARRPEAFFRFILHHLNKELSSKKLGVKVIDDLCGFTFVSVNEFITGSGPPTVSTHRAMTIDLSYDPFVKADAKVRFGEVLRHALSKESRLRAWCQATRSYATVVQRKIAASLPPVFALSCACAGKRNEEGLSIWRTSAPENGHWLPEIIEVELQDDGNLIVRELVEEEGEPERIWKEFKGASKLSSSVSDIVKSNLGSTRKHRYRLDGVLSFVRDDMDAAMIEQLSISPSDEATGHHVLHARIPADYKSRALDTQRIQAEELALAMESAPDDPPPPETLTSTTKPEVFRKRAEEAKKLMEASEESKSDNEWVLFNGFVVSPTVVEDARAFHIPFKEPCLVIFRAMDEDEKQASKETDKIDATKIPINVMQTRSISTGQPPKHDTKSPGDLPGPGDLIAFDAEFVSVQEEESVLTNTGSKVTLRETRHALARVSVIDCRNGDILIDDHVVPPEPVVDYLTRFSGIVESDLDPKTSPHHLISMRSAYLKLRFLAERGCIFVGHGLTRDFATVNLVVPPNQIVDTVELFHRDRMRWISLRFLTNYVFGHDMQQDIHDSVEDARAAYKLYQKALELKREGTFDKYLQDLYVYGAARDWKLGVDE